jgi:hypothetical protein
MSNRNKSHASFHRSRLYFLCLHSKINSGTLVFVATCAQILNELVIAAEAKLEVRASMLLKPAPSIIKQLVYADQLDSFTHPRA